VSGPTILFASPSCGRNPGRDARPGGPEKLQATLAAICPYRGLLYFREEDALSSSAAPWHRAAGPSYSSPEPARGRGRSGSGKSSVVRAGGARATEDRDKVWEVATWYRATARCMRCHGVGAALGAGKDQRDGPADCINKQSVRFRTAIFSCATSSSGCCKSSPYDRLLLIVDQWEELYTLTPDLAVRRRFLDDCWRPQPCAAVRGAHPARDFVGRPWLTGRCRIDCRMPDHLGR